MRVLNRYLMTDFFVSFGMTLLVFTFVMSLGAVVKAIDLGARGVSGLLLLKFFSFNIPYMLTFTLPMSVLTATLLLFGRLSFDGELTAMRASGMSLWQVIAPVVFISIAVSTLCIAITAEIAPRARHAMRSALVQLGAEDPINLLEAGRFVRDFPGLMIYIGSRSGSRVTDVIVYELADEGTDRNVRAKYGTLRTDKEAKVMYIDLYEVRIDQRDEKKQGDTSQTQYINASHYPVRLDFSEMQNKTVRRKVSDLVFFDLLNAIRDIKGIFPELKKEDMNRQRMTLVVEANKRLALSISCFAFTLLAVPLGMRSKRKESSVGIGIALLMVFFFYLFIIVANSLVKHPEFRPDLIVWIPVIGAEIAGYVLIRRMM
ncbi:MAG: LptF/LptG family permease [Verrucomicrobia bacterium]|nr:LptF/LptG family permease [Verrucomicrobiota bacterium]